MKIVITGGTGFLGLMLARALVKRGRLTAPSGKPEEIDEILLFDVAAPPTRPAGLDDRVKIATGEISDKERIAELTDRDDTVYSVEIRPLSGKGTVHNVPFEPEVLVDDPTERNERATELEDR